MRVEHFMNFDTHAAVKRLIAVGLQDRVAEEVVTSIALGRDYDFSKLVTKEEFFNFKEEFFKFREEFSEYKQEVSERFNKIETEIALIKQEIKALRKEFKAEISVLRQEQETGFATLSIQLSAEIVKSKHETLRWIIGLFIALAVAIFIKY